MESAAVCLSQESTHRSEEKKLQFTWPTINNQQQHDAAAAAAAYLILENPINQISAFSWPPVALYSLVRWFM